MRANLLSIVRAMAVSAATVAGACCGISAPASATTWFITGSLDDGSTASGFFSWTSYGYLDSTPGTTDIKTTGGSLLSGYEYINAPPYPPGAFPEGPGGPSVVIYAYSGSIPEVTLQITFKNALLTSTSPDPIVGGVGGPSFECLSWTCPGPDTGQVGANTRYFTSGFATTIGTSLSSETPLPAALPLFATGLGALGLLGWRRKRKALAA